jgi:hypothetical protein
MSFEETNYDNPEDGGMPEESNNNRTFMIAAGILGGIILLSIACLVGVYLFTRSANATASAQATNVAVTSVANENFISTSLTSTAEAAILPTATLEPTAVVNVPTITTTPDPNATSSVAGAGTSVAATATVGAALTQAAIAQLTIVPTTTALPKTGFADEFGIPGLVVMSLAFIIVILISRRLRFTPSR